jgi:hypothetical protein
MLKFSASEESPKDFWARAAHYSGLTEDHMREKRYPKALLWLSAGLAIAGSAPPVALAQAWLPPKGEASISEGAQYSNARYHLLFDGRRDDRGVMEWYHAITDVSYSVTDRFAVQLGIPYVISRYTGNFPHRPVGRPTIDDGAWHRTFQDLSVEVRFMATTGSLVVTPFLAGGMPAAHYERLGHAAAGRYVREYTAGVNLGRRLDPILPNGYAHARLSFTMPERVLGIWHNRNNADVELGHFVGRSVGLRVLAEWQWTHGGLRIPLDAPAGSATAAVHDQLSKDSRVVLGAGVTFAATGSLDLSATAMKTMSGENSLLLRGVSLAATWSFSPARLIRGRPDSSPRVGPRIP